LKDPSGFTLGIGTGEEAVEPHAPSVLEHAAHGANTSRFLKTAMNDAHIVWWLLGET
jgi:hypothetical protein